jgi:hypothetical protein
MLRHAGRMPALPVVLAGYARCRSDLSGPAPTVVRPPFMDEAISIDYPDWHA